MTRAELIVAVAEKAKLDRKSAEKAVAATFETIKDALVEGDKVQVLGFGTFENRTRAARKGRNPRTGEEIEIQSSKLPSFKAGKSLKEAVNY
ncbi:MAG: HU family DNA-binding protein [Selenomonadaceae bacterium]|nr:HU family DNA-binding protein [Selenomonadaceae bacterium]MBQ3442170.1 HU family DNA-binding protein [Selenomonadaceae bacterium]MBQ4495732.1 HU family DNA-binding protein [Selenomonadaceae bacterium]MBQ6759675.1 HU family DNA-binding protein [Selenomonadaceae bacterium]MBR0102819.1 HU family DNA-binding protein [Selenomonadaceae bacterium]